MQETKTFEYECECESCDGTGLYVGFAERDGAAVVCSRCGGTGKQKNKIKYKTFDKKKERKGIKRVFQTNPGIGIGQGHNRQTGEKYRLSDFGGMSYEDWKSGVPFRPGMEMRQFTCPAWWYQGADYKNKPEWKECICCGSFSGCEKFGQKEKCWEKWDRENTRP